MLARWSDGRRLSVVGSRMTVPFLVRPGQPAELNSKDTRLHRRRPRRLSARPWRHSQQQRRSWARSTASCSPRSSSRCSLSYRASTPRARTARSRHVFGGLDPSAAWVAAVRRAHLRGAGPRTSCGECTSKAPRTGEIVIFNRSHYEDVLVVRVHKLLPERVWRPRFRAHKRFERLLSARRTRVVKILLHISSDETVQTASGHDSTDLNKRWKATGRPTSQISSCGTNTRLPSRR